MSKKKRIIIAFTSILVLSFIINDLALADDVLIPGPPHEFYGTVKDIDGNNVADGTEIKALVDNETYNTTVKNGKYGFNEPYYPPLESDPAPFYVEDPGFDNEGKTIYFYVGGINTSQSVKFINGGITRLDLVVNLNAGGNEGNGGGVTTSDENNHELIPPVADAKGPYRGRVNQTIVFYGSDSYDPDGSIVNYTWDFGDNSSTFEINPVHSYAKEGVYTVTLTVIDNDNLSNTTMTTASIFIDSDGDGWSDEEEELYGTNSSDPDSFPSDNDGDYIPDDYDDNDDNDGLTDDEELSLGSNPKDSSDVIQITSRYGVFFFVDIGGDGTFDVYYNKTSKINTTLFQMIDGKYLVDVNGDGEWDYIYDYGMGHIDVYIGNEESGGILPNLSILLVVAILIIILLIIGILIYGRKFRGGNK